MIFAILLSIALGVAIERKRVRRRAITISRMPTRLERDELATPTVTRRQIDQRTAVYGQRTRIEVIDV